MDKRPLGVMGAVFFITAIVLSKLGFDKALYVLPVILLVALFCFLRRKKIKFFLLFMSSVLCASAVFFFADTQYKINAASFSGQEVSVEGVICEVPYYPTEKNRIIIKASKINGEDANIKIRVNVSENIGSDKLYDKVKLKANLYKPDTYDYIAMSSIKSKNICLTGSCLSGTIKITKNENKPLGYYIISYRHKLFDTVAEILPNDIGGFIIGITIGEEALMSEELQEEFRITGTSHILVVSGLHVAVWSGFVYWLIRKLFSQKVSCIASIIFILLFMAFTGFTASVIRSGAMMILSYVARLFNEKSDPLNSLGISAIILTCINPFSIYNVGTVFSFASVFGILLANEYVLKPIDKKLIYIKFKPLSKVLKSLISLIVVSLAAQIFTFPISVIYEIKFSFLSVISNLFVSFLSDVVMVTGGIGTVLLAVSPIFFLGKLFFGVSVLATRLIVFVIHELAKLENLYQNVTTLTCITFIILMSVLIFTVLFSSLPAKRKAAVTASLLLPVVFLSSLTNYIYQTKFINFSVIDVGYGMCVTFSHLGETVMLSCSGDYLSQSKITSSLEFLNTKKIKAIYLPVNDGAALVNKASVIKSEFETESVITSSEYKFSYVSKNSTSADYVFSEYWGNKMTVEYYTFPKSSFAFVKIGTTRILVSFYGKILEENLPHHCKNPDVYVTMYSNTYKTDFSATKEYVVSNSLVSSIPQTAVNFHTTYNDSTYTKSILV